MSIVPKNVTLCFLAFLSLWIGCKGEDDIYRGNNGESTDTIPWSDSSEEEPTQCSESAEHIYLLDSEANLYGFHPPEKKFRFIATIDCDVGPLAAPYSMAIARDGTAYVLYRALGCVGIFPVSILDGTCGEKTDFVCGTKGFTSFGMGFVTLTAETQLEDLYIGNVSKLAILDPEDWDVDIMGDLRGNPEFTGNAKGELWGFFTTTNPPRVAQLNKNTGRLIETWTLPSLSSFPSAWAFAFWGGSFYIFYTALMGVSTNVYRVEDGVIEPYMIDTGKRIVGAGVSTCAPLAPVL